MELSQSIISVIDDCLKEEYYNDQMSVIGIIFRHAIRRDNTKPEWLKKIYTFETYKEDLIDIIPDIDDQIKPIFDANIEICGLDLFRHIHEIIMNKCIKLCKEMGLYYDDDSMIIAPTDYTKTSISGILELLQIMDKLKEQKLISHDSYIGRRYSEGCIEEQYKTETETDRFGKFEGYEHDDFGGDYNYYPGYK